METNTTEKSPAELFLDRLRTATGPMHKGLEENTISKSLMNPHVDLTDYAFYLRCMSDVVRVYDEMVLPAVKAIVVDAEGRKKMVDIEADLSFLYANGATKKDSKPFQGFIGKPSLAYALGYAYVIEGSTLGGRVILKHLNQTLQLGENGTRFFAGYGAETGSFWKGFLQQFCDYVLTNKTEEEAIQGAIDGFTDIGRHFANNG